jgi:serine protease Do
VRFVLAIGVCLAAAATACAQVAAPPPAAISAAPAASPGSVPFTSWALANVHPAVARIVAPGNGTISYGSGTLVHAEGQFGLVVTNWHVINEATAPVSVHFPDGFYSLGTIESVDRDWDLALISIRKPNAAPVALAGKAPQPGETLTIAGYGSGHYRAASGACTQYVAPGLEFPYEMVEVAVSARQGDSGGPIFNSNGELAGVLFGEGQGRTSGSYCGRVRWFLSSVVPKLNQRGAIAATTGLKPIPARPTGIAAAPGQPQVQPPATAKDELLAQGGGVAAQSSAWQSAPMDDDQAPPLAATNAPEGELPQVKQLGWHDIAGESLGEQAKTVLAAVGVLAIILQVLRLLSREPAAA